MECLLALLTEKLESWIAFIGKIDTFQSEAGQDIEVKFIDSLNCFSSKITFTKLSETLLKQNMHL